ncbi:hypothetical protein DFP74_3904 [Nocardiopsis sp. Huas11]|uniref:hypothetical protein n=1 Tax=Nocardiopsis sp. Huas11 TaxID=2183912 RepID=UPI000F278FD3|nr:hypothetical protein [Nocardiopsis sp. Huas11]RKS08209.1 hypothetical protein DFP74_3904 [Nocardiopsis sp. Huas11]
MPAHEPPVPGRRQVCARPVSLPPPRELAHAALRTALLRDALGLALWSAPCTPVTPRGLPALADVRDAVERLGLWPHSLAHSPCGRAAWLEGMAAGGDVADFVVPWETAVGLGMVVLDGGLARPRPALRERARTPDHVLDWWVRVFENTFEYARGDGEGGSAPAPGTSGPELLPHVLRYLYEAPDGFQAPLGTLVQDVLLAPGAVGALPERLRPHAGALLLRALRQLATTGAVLLPAAHDDPGARDAPLVELTALGRYGVRRLLQEVGVQAPLIGDLAGADAAEFLDTLATLSTEGQLTAVGPWLDRRTPARALREIASVVSGPGRSQRRWAGTKVLNATSSQIEHELRALLHSARPAVVSLAAIVLLTSRMLPQHEIDQIMSEFGPWVVIDMFAASMAGGEAGIRFLLDADDTSGIERLLLADPVRLWESEHPDTARVLGALARHHPDPETAAAAVRVLHLGRTEE